MPRHHDLINHWRACPLAEPPYLLPGDEALLDSDCVHPFHSLEEYVASSSFGVSDDHVYHLGLLPKPFVGSLERASIFILMLNPGFMPIDYLAEHHIGEFRSAAIGNLRQEPMDHAFPFFSLNPRFSWHSGFTYWHRRLAEIARELSGCRRISYRAALSELAQTVCGVELVPYHSAYFGLPRPILRRLASVQLVVDFVHNVLVPRAVAGDAVIIAARSARYWKLPPRRKNIVVYERGETRGAHLSLNSRGGRAIAKHLGL